MSDYIKREDAIQLCVDIINYRTTEMINMGSVEPAERINVIELAYKKLPSADVVERADYEQLKFILDKQIEHGLTEPKRGEWIWDKDGIDWNIGAWRCSECGSRNANIGCNGNENPMRWSGSRFCPNCGADMREREGE